MNLKISKPKTRPIQIEPWFFKYLNEGQIKVVAAILSHADMKDRKSNSFPSNRTIAFYCGFGDIKENSKAYDKYKSLSTEEEKIKFKNKRIKTAIITVANIKKSLEDIIRISTDVIEKDTKKILFDTGLGKALFYNAKILNIDLKDIDYVILSHSHNDHTGGLNEFLKINSRAKVIAHKEIFIEKYSKRTGEMRFIGLSKDDLDLARFQFVENTYKLSENISLYGNLLEYNEAREKNHFVKIKNEYTE